MKNVVGDDCIARAIIGDMVRAPCCRPSPYVHYVDYADCVGVVGWGCPSCTARRMVRSSVLVDAPKPDLRLEGSDAPFSALPSHNCPQEAGIAVKEEELDTASHLLQQLLEEAQAWRRQIDRLSVLSS